jgi:hypothetical protein
MISTLQFFNVPEVSPTGTTLRSLICSVTQHLCISVQLLPLHCEVDFCSVCITRRTYFFVVKGPAVDATDAPQP